MELSEKVKKGITHCIESKACIECPYDGRDFPRCFVRIGKDALSYIRELEAKVAEYERPLKPLPEVEIYGDEPVWLEMRAECDEPRIVDIIPSFVNPAERAEIAFMGQSRRWTLPRRWATVEDRHSQQGFAGNKRSMTSLNAPIRRGK